MKKNILTIIILFFSINIYAFDPVEFCQKNYYLNKPTDAEITERFNRHERDDFKSTYEVLSQLNPNDYFLKKANASTFHTIFFLHIFPDSKTKNINYKISDERIALWDNGYTYIWDLKRPDTDTPNFGNSEGMKYKQILSTFPKDECLFFIVIYIKK